MIELSLIQYIFSVIAGILVGFSLGLIGGGGSILAVPLFALLRWTIKRSRSISSK